MTKVKICGLSRPCDIEVANRLMPEYVGFVFAKSPRQVCAEQARALKEQLHPDIAAVGVFVDERIEHIVSLVEQGIVDIVQLHGKEDELYIEALKAVIDVPIIKAITVCQAGDAQKWETSSADYLLLDSGSGGSGLPFDWRVIGALSKPYFLAGGLCADLAQKALEDTSAFGLDVSSGVETDGVKDATKMERFMSAVRPKGQSDG